LERARQRTRSQRLKIVTTKYDITTSNNIYTSTSNNGHKIMYDTITVTLAGSTRSSSSRIDSNDDKSNNENDTATSKSTDNSNNNNNNNLTHKDIVWKLRPPAGTSFLKRLWLRLAATMIRFDCFLFRKKTPTVLCPKGGQALLEAHIRNSQNKLVKVGRFGFTTERGKPAQQIQDTAHDIYNIPNNIILGVAAIIYMFVEPKYRKRDIGKLALEVIGCIHSIQGCDFTVLVVDDDGSGKLVDWYTKNMFTKAPKLQHLMGSPNEIHGVTMIAPTNSRIQKDCRIRWW